MGTSGLVGQICMYSDMAPRFGSLPVIAAMLLVHVLLPIVICLPIDRLLRRIGWVKNGDMTIRS